mmetsp:Transcript_10811/g.33355  ORF Transcript_10811/g.33355 Transcript_10811/m.33355 type:complete len:118 (+) Transcript_10811:137-490(+)
MEASPRSIDAKALRDACRLLRVALLFAFASPTAACLVFYFGDGCGLARNSVSRDDGQLRISNMLSRARRGRPSRGGADGFRRRRLPTPTRLQRGDGSAAAPDWCAGASAGRAEMRTR